MKRRVLVLLLAVLAVLGSAVGGTLAWLSARATPVVNTFSASGIEINLTETTDDYQMVPGRVIAKDPEVTVRSGSEACYLFVKLEASDNFADFLTCEIADGWTQGTGDSGNGVPENVYFRIVMSDPSNQSYGVLLNNQVTVKSEVTQAMMEPLTQDSYPTLVVTAYASQLYRNNTETFSAAEAWANIGS